MGNRTVQPAIAPPAAGAIRNGSAPLFQYADGVWNHGEGFLAAGAVDSGGWFEHDDGTHVTAADVHTPFGWQDFDWLHPTHPLGVAPGHRMKRLYGYLRPAAAGNRPTQHPLYGDLTTAGASGPFGDRSYVDQGAFEIFRPNYSPYAGEKVVIVINTRQTSGFANNKDGDMLRWRQVYPGFFSPDGLRRREQAGVTRSPDVFFANDGLGDVDRPPPIVIARAMANQNYYPIFAYAVPSVMHRETELNQQRDLQLVQAIKEILMEDPALGRNPFSEVALTPAEIEADVYVVFSGGSNGGLQAMWSVLRHPELVHGNLSAAMSASKQRLIGELDMNHTVSRLTGSGAGSSEASERDLLHWGHYAWNQGFWIHDLSPMQLFARGELHRPCLFAAGDEDITGTGTDWIRTVTGGAWQSHGAQTGLSPLGNPLVNRFAWTAGENGCHGEAQWINAYDGTTEFFADEMLLELIPDVIAQKDALGTTAIPALPSEPRSLAQELHGLDDPHEWALGRIGTAMTADPGLTRNDAWFHATQHGAAGTLLGHKESMLIRDGALYVGSAEGVVSKFVVDPVSKSLVKQAHSNPGDASPSLPFGTPMALGHEAFAITTIAYQAGFQLVVGTRRHLHLLDPVDLTVVKSKQLPWELGRPRHLKVGNVLPDAFHAGDEVVFCSELGGLAFYDDALQPLWEWPEPGILDFHVAGSEVGILSQRGVVARVHFLHSAGGPVAQLLASSKPMPGPGEYETVFTQGDPVDLERMHLDLGFWGGGSTPEYVAAWNNDGDAGGVRVYGGVGLGLVAMAGQMGKISDIATTNQPVGYLGQDTTGDHLLVLAGTRLRLLNQAGMLQGEVDLHLRQDPANLTGPALDYSFGNDAISLVVGELHDPGQSFDYSDEVVIGTHSGALVWLHVEEVKGALHPLPSPEFDLAVGSSSQPRTNQNLSATWAVSVRELDDELHCLDRRGAYWTLSDTGLAFQGNSSFAKNKVAWVDAGHRGGVPPTTPILFGPGVFLPTNLAAGVLGEANFVQTRPWAPIESRPVYFENSSRWQGDNWLRDRVFAGLFRGFVMHERAGHVIEVAPDVKQVWYWSGRGSASGVVGDWGNLVEAYELNLGSDTVSGYWASVGDWPGGAAACPHHDLRSFTTQIASMNQQSIKVAVLSDGALAVFLGCPGGRVRCVQPGAMRRDNATTHGLGSLHSSADLGFGGGALAIEADANDVVTIWFGTLAHPAARPASSIASATLDDSTVVAGAVHRMTWTSSSGFSSPTTTVLSPNTNGAARGGYGVVGLIVANVLGGPQSPDEVVVGTVAGDILIFDRSLTNILWKAHVPGSAGCFNSLYVEDLDLDGTCELYVCGSFGIWRYEQ